MLDKIKDITEVKSSRNNSSIPESQSHKASIVMPKISRKDPKKSPVISKKKPYAYNSNVQCNNDNKRSRNSSKTGSYFTTGNKLKSPGEKLSKYTRTNDSKCSRGSDGFKEVDMFTFAKQSPLLKPTPKTKHSYRPTPKSPKNSIKTPTSYTKQQKRTRETHKSSMNQSSQLCSTRLSNKARSSDKNKAVIGRQITSQASK